MVGRILSIVLNLKPAAPKKKPPPAATLKCRFCSSSFKDENGRKNHEQSVHTLTCEECNVKFATLKHLHAHTKSDHKTFHGMVVPEQKKEANVPDS